MNHSQTFYGQEPSSKNNGWTQPNNQHWGQSSCGQYDPAQEFGKFQLPNEVWLEQQPLGTIGEVPFIPDSGSKQGQLVITKRVKEQLNRQKFVCEKALNKVNKAIENLDEKIKTLENSEEIVVSVVMEKFMEASISRTTTEEMKEAFEVLKKLFIK